MTVESGGQPAHESLMTETDPAIIDAQIAAGVAQYGAADFLGNFQEKLPDGVFRKSSFMFGIYIRERDSPMASFDGAEERRRRGPRALDPQVTWGTFFADIDAAVEAAAAEGEISLDELAALRAEMRRTHSDEDRNTFAEHILSVYRRLRAMGYSHHDLWI